MGIEYIIPNILALPYNHHWVYQKEAALFDVIKTEFYYLGGNERTAIYLIHWLVRQSGYVIAAYPEEIQNMLDN